MEDHSEAATPVAPMASTASTATLVKESIKQDTIQESSPPPPPSSSAAADILSALAPTASPPQTSQPRRPRQRRSISSQSALSTRSQLASRSQQHRQAAAAATSSPSSAHTLQDLQNEQSYHLHNLQRHDERARALLASLAAAQQQAQQQEQHDDHHHQQHQQPAARRLDREIRLLGSKLEHNRQQERATLARLGDLYVEVRARQRWCHVLEQQELEQSVLDHSGSSGHEALRGDGGAMPRWPLTVDTSGLGMPPPLGWMQDAASLMLSPLSPTGSVPLLTPLSPLSPVFVPGAYFNGMGADVGLVRDGPFWQSEEEDCAAGWAGSDDDQERPRSSSSRSEEGRQNDGDKGRTRSLSFSAGPTSKPASKRFSLPAEKMQWLDIS